MNGEQHAYLAYCLAKSQSWVTRAAEQALVTRDQKLIDGLGAMELELLTLTRRHDRSGARNLGLVHDPSERAAM